jgi:hypothetical protein
MDEVRKFELEMTVQPGPIERVDPVVDTALDLGNLLWHVGVQGHFDPYTLVLVDVESGETLPVQWEDGLLSMILYGRMAAGSERSVRLTFDVLPLGVRAVSPRKNNFTDRVVVTDVGREVLFSKNQRELCRYKHRDEWKPYFFPVNGPDGNVVRDRIYNAEGHHFHHGLWLAYGSMDHNSVNLWCEDDRILPRRGPTGRIAHESFERFTFGWVYGLVRERLIYCKPDGKPFTRELRTIRVYAPTSETVVIDWKIRLVEPQDTGRRGITFACRVAPSMRLVDKSRGWNNEVPMEKPGKIEDGAEHPWVDYSGPVGDGWNGIAMFDHPDNPDYPIQPRAQGYGIMSIGREYPQDDLHRGGAINLRYRAYVHDGDAAEGRVDQAWHDFAHPCLVVPGEIRAFTE